MKTIQKKSEQDTHWQEMPNAKLVCKNAKPKRATRSLNSEQPASPSIMMVRLPGGGKPMKLVNLSLKRGTVQSWDKVCLDLGRRRAAREDKRATQQKESL